MKKAILALVIAFAILFTACDYRFVPNKGRLIVPFGKDYFLTEMSKYSSIFGISSEKVAKLYRDEPVEFEEYVCTMSGLPDEILVYQTVGFHGWFESPVLFVEDGYDMPTFNSIDKIENMFFITPDDECNFYVYKLFESGKEINGDINDFIEEFYSYRTEYDVNSSWSSRNIEAECMDFAGKLFYKFKDIDDAVFKMWIYTTDNPDMYMTQYTLGESFYSIVFPKELLKKYFPAEL